MKLAKFTYTDVKGKITDRTVLVTSEPSDKLKGIDMSEVDHDDMFDFTTEYNAIQETFYAAIEALKTEYDLKHNFRQFFANKIDGMVKVDF